MPVFLEPALLLEDELRHNLVCEAYLVSFWTYQAWWRYSLKVVVTNDILYSSLSLSEVWANYVSLVRLLLRSVSCLVLCELLPVANKKRNASYSKSISTFNFLVSFDHIFLTSEGNFKSHLYCAKLGSRPDFLHPLKAGLKAMHLFLSAEVSLRLPTD